MPSCAVPGLYLPVTDLFLPLQTQLSRAGQQGLVDRLAVLGTELHRRGTMLSRASKQKQKARNSRGGLEESGDWVSHDEAARVISIMAGKLYSKAKRAEMRSGRPIHYLDARDTMVPTCQNRHLPEQAPLRPLPLLAVP